MKEAKFKGFFLVWDEADADGGFRYKIRGVTEKDIVWAKTKISEGESELLEWFSEKGWMWAKEYEREALVKGKDNGIYFYFFIDKDLQWWDLRGDKLVEIETFRGSNVRRVKKRIAELGI